MPPRGHVMSEQRRPSEVEYRLSGIPPLVGPCTLLVGLDECEDGSVKAYLGARWKGIYLHVEPEGAEDFRRAWGSGGHVWMYPVPPADLLCKDEPKEPADA